MEGHVSAQGGNDPDEMTMPSLGALHNASSAAASTAARAIDWPGQHDAYMYTVLLRATSAYNARPRIRGGSDGLALGGPELTLASHGLEEPFFISSCAVVSVFCSGGK
jgi:hypothetical protein